MEVRVEITTGDTSIEIVKSAEEIRNMTGHPVRRNQLARGLLIEAVQSAADALGVEPIIEKEHMP